VTTRPPPAAPVRARTPLTALFVEVRCASEVESAGHAGFDAAFAAAAREAGATPAAAGREPLVLLPGMLGDGRLWDGVAPALEGRATPRIGRIDLDDSVAEIAESVLAAAPERFALAGHSLGAIVALETVRRAPGRVTRLALLNATARRASEAQVDAWATLRERTEGGEFVDVAREFARVNLPRDGARDSTLEEQMEAMALGVGAAGFLRQLSAQRTRPDLRPSLPDVDVPTLVVSGAEDQVCPRPLQDELAAAIRDAEHVTVEGAGHMTPLEAPGSVGEHLVAWLGR
jgi:pimeloyl-ACP methyl ester carboxylesterase